MFVAIISIQDNSSSLTTIVPAILVAATNDTIHGNSTKSLSTKSGVDCAKECPCDIPKIPVPDQWLEVMVTGGFKVWHIIFIIIALIVTIVVVYCCFHRCRIPRTKQEIEADLMRTNMTSKFRDYLQELPNEPVTFIEVLKRVSEMEEKHEKDDAQPARDAGMRKRMGWLKLKGKNTPTQNAFDIEAGQATVPANSEDTANDASTALGPASDTPIATKDQQNTTPQNVKENSKIDVKTETVTAATATTTTTTKQQVTMSKSSLDVEAATKLVKEQQNRARHAESRKKRSSPQSHNNNEKDLAVNAGDTPIDGNDKLNVSSSDDKHLIRRRKHNKPNLARSKVVREKTHPSIDMGPSSGHNNEGKPMTTTIDVDGPQVHEQTEVTFEDSALIVDGNQSNSKPKKRKIPKKSVSSSKASATKKLKRVSKTEGTKKQKDL